MTSEQALKEIKENAHWGRVYITAHARKRMRERFVFEDDIYEAIDTAYQCTPDEENWCVTGLDCDGDELTLVISIEGQNVIITIF